MGSVKSKLVLRLGSCLGVILLTFIAKAAVSTPVLDYWEKSPELWKEITEKRRVLVSAKNEGGRAHSKGVGVTKASVASLWSFVTDVEKIKKSSRFLKDFKWDQSSGEVEMTLELLSIQHVLKGRAEKFPDSENPRVVFHVLEGSLMLFDAELEIRSAKAQVERGERLKQVSLAVTPRLSPEQTLVRVGGISAEGRELSWPFLVAVEAVLQRTAAALRDAVEQESGGLEKAEKS